MKYKVSVRLTNLGPILSKKVFKHEQNISHHEWKLFFMPKYRPCFNKNVFGCVKCSIYDLKISISLFSKAYRHLILGPFLKKNSKIMPFYVHQSACHILGNICDTSRIPTVLIKNFSSLTYYSGLQIVLTRSSRLRLVVLCRHFIWHTNPFLSKVILHLV